MVSPSVKGRFGGSWPCGGLNNALTVRPVPVFWPPADSTTTSQTWARSQAKVESAGGQNTGTGLTVKALFNPSQGQLSPNLPFALRETIDYPHGVTNGAGGACYPLNGKVSAQVNPISKLALDFQGQACEMAAGPGEVIVDGHYIGAPSTGAVADLDAVGSIDIESPSGLEDMTNSLKASLTGHQTFTCSLSPAITTS